VGDAGILVGEQQAPALHCIFSSACAAAGLPVGPEGPQLLVGASAETAIYCIRVPTAARAAVAVLSVSSATLPAVSVVCSSWQPSAATLERSCSAPLTAEPHDASPPAAAQQPAAGGDDSRPHSGGNPAATTSKGSANLQLDRSRWRGSRFAAAGGQLVQRRQAAEPGATCLAVVITGALVDLLTVCCRLTLSPDDVVCHSPINAVVGLWLPCQPLSVSDRCTSYRQHLRQRWALP
jgi:hypothetical protein